ncbi:hypothetical protein [Halomonas sp. LBP4]|uniref:hypothetical protein n=1 Tax=Halomonas sp. LBP4 TaxID=2044917 RepID=UPI0011B44A06|nr:hypothetical protein [Halomonas sp. LBP4]
MPDDKPTLSGLERRKGRRSGGDYVIRDGEPVLVHRTQVPDDRECGYSDQGKRYDDELKAIQADLDSVLDRLGDYLERQNSAARLLLDMEAPHGADTKAEMLDTLRLYLASTTGMTLDEAHSRATAEKGAACMERNRRVREHGAIKGKLLFAFEEVSGKRYDPALMGHSRYHLLQPEELATLAEMAARYLDRRDRYPGEYGKHDLLMHKGKRDEYGLAKRQQAVNEFIDLREKHGADKYPFDRETCQPIAEKYGFTGETLVREVRKRLDETLLRGNLDASGNLRLVIAKLWEVAKIKPHRKKD